MISDLRTILDGWAFEPGKISVRKIIGRDGHEKIQTRIDLGVLQLECAGRPDGRRPNGCESLLVFHEQRLREHVSVYGDDEEFILTPEECRALRHESYLYYQRYLSLYVLEEYEGVVRDTARNLRAMALCERYAATERDRQMLRPQRAYVMMMHSRARAQAALATGDAERALAITNAGLAELDHLGASEAEEDAVERELAVLRELRREILDELPDGAPARLQAALDAALAREDYEQAARLRDRMRPRAEPGVSAS